MSEAAPRYMHNHCNSVTPWDHSQAATCWYEQLGQQIPAWSLSVRCRCRFREGPVTSGVLRTWQHMAWPAASSPCCLESIMSTYSFLIWSWLAKLVRWPTAHATDGRRALLTQHPCPSCRMCAHPVFGHRSGAVFVVLSCVIRRPPGAGS